MARFYVKVNTDEDSFAVDTSGSIVTVDVEAPAKQGRANAELTRCLSKRLGTEVGIVSGHRSSRKTVAVDMDEADVYKKLEQG